MNGYDMCGILKDNCRVVLSHVTSAARVFGISHGSEKKVEDTAFVWKAVDQYLTPGRYETFSTTSQP